MSTDDRQARARGRQAAAEADRKLRRTKGDLDRKIRRSKGDLDRKIRRGKGDLDRKIRQSTGSLDRKIASQARAKGGGDGQTLDDAILVWALPVAAVAAFPLVVGHVSALAFSGDWPSYPLTDAPGIIGRLASDPGDPAGAWAPVNDGGSVPGAAAWWGAFIVLAVLVGLVALLAWAALHTSSGGAGTGAGAGFDADRRLADRARPGPARPGGAFDRHAWASAADQRPLRRTKGERHRVVVGTGAGGHPLAVRHHHSLLVVGPAQAGKTSAVAVPAVLEWEGPVVVASTKGHLIDETIGWRSHQGEVHVYDPAGVSRYQRSGWSVLAECSTWHGAIRTATDMTLAARVAAGTRAGDADREVDGTAGSLSMALAPYLLAAVASGRTIGKAIQWIERQERDEVLEVLSTVDRGAARAHRSTFERPDSSRTQYLQAMSDVLSVYQDPVVAASMNRQDIEPAALFDGDTSTVYLTTPEQDQALYRPLCAMLVRRLLAAAYEASAQRGRPLDPPLLVLLDDVVGVAPVHDLAGVASTASSRGIQLISVVQDVTQVEAHYGDRAPLVVQNHAARLVFPAPWDRDSHRRSLGGDAADHLADGEAALVYGPGRPTKVRLRPWYGDRELRRRVETPQDAVAAAEREDSSVPGALRDHTAATWIRRGSQRHAPRSDGEDATIPLETNDPRYVEVFGAIEDPTALDNVTQLQPPRRER